MYYHRLDRNGNLVRTAIQPKNCTNWIHETVVSEPDEPYITIHTLEDSKGKQTSVTCYSGHDREKLVPALIKNRLEANK